MAKPQDPDEIVDNLMDELDINNEAAIDARSRQLDAERDGFLTQISAGFERDQVQPNQRIREVDERLGPEKKDLEDRTKARQPSVDRAAAWREAGIRERVFALDLPTPVRRIVLGLLAMVDFYVFAIAVAEAQEVAASFTEPLFLVGGSLGIFVFGVGLLLARVIKRAFYAIAQKRMLKDMRKIQSQGVEKRRLQPKQEPEWVLMGVLGALFGTLCCYAFAIRWQAMDPTENPNVVVFMSLIPLIGLAVEMVIYDPSMVEPPRQSLRHRRLLHQRDVELATLRELKAEATHEQERIKKVYEVARARWESRLADGGASRRPGEHRGDGAPGGSNAGGSNEPRPDDPYSSGNGANSRESATDERLGGHGR
jgi:hypothetical protein